jgi:PAS domain S-box-containing protein
VAEPFRPGPDGLAGATAARRQSGHYRRQFEAIARNATASLFVTDARQRCTYMNPAAESMTGYTLAEVEGRPLHDVIHHTRPDGRPYPLSECPIDQAVPRRMREQGEEVFVHRDGHFYPVAFTASPIMDDGEPVGAVIEVRDIGVEKRRRAESALAARIGTVVTHAAPLPEVLQRCVDAAAEHLEAALARVWTLDEAGRQLELQAVAGRCAHPDGRGARVAVGVRKTGRIAEQRRPHLTNDVANDAWIADRAWARRTGIVAFAGYPLLVGGRTVGVLELFSRRTLSVQTLETLGAVADAMAVAIDRAHANEDLQRINRELISRNTAAERAGHDAEEARAVMDAFYEAAPVPAALVDRNLCFRRINTTLAAFYGRTPDEVVGRSIREIVPEYADRVEPYYHKVLATGHPLRNVEVTILDPAGSGRELHYLTNYFPVRVRGEVIGVGLVALDVTERQEIERARSEQATVAETLHRIGRTIASELDQHRIVQDVTDAATALTGAESGDFCYNIVDETGRSRAVHSMSGSPVSAAQLKSRLAVPVISRTGSVLGRLRLGHEQPGAFTEQHAQVAAGIASWAALALDNARLFVAESRARSEAESADRAKSEFLATMSHELRTPLNVMIGYADLLMAGVPEQISPAALQKVERIAFSAQHLLELIEEILTFSRLEAGSERIRIRDLDLPELLADVRSRIEPLALERGVRFQCGSAPAGLFRSDPRNIRRILLNLLDNAVKFTEGGVVSLRVEARDQALFFRVEDSGRGIAPEHLERVFEPFWQVDGGPTRTNGGTGLGLSVARRLARLLGGDVTLESDVGRGSVFTLIVPASIPASVH